MAETSSDLDSLDESDTESGSSHGIREHKKLAMQQMRRPSLLVQPGRHHYGSFYLRMGAVGELPLVFRRFSAKILTFFLRQQHLASAA